MRTFFIKHRTLLTASLVGVVCFVAGMQHQTILAAVAPSFGWRVSTDSLDLASLQQTYRQLQANYDGQLDTQALLHGASRGLTAAAGDEHTVYLDPEEAAEFDKSLEGDIGGGIGAEIGLRQHQPTIIRPLNDSPAQRAGIKAGARILEVNAQSVAGWPVDAVVEKIRGEVGTEVKLTVLQEGQKKSVAVTRQQVTAPSVESTIDGQTAVLKISRFGDDTATLARRAAESFRQSGVTKVIVDLRGNPGGTVSSARAIAGLWLHGQVVLTEKRGSEVIRTERSVGQPLLDGIKTVVLIDEGSASASEIVAGALKDHGKATLIGQKSFGKGSVQVVLDLPSGAKMKVTQSRWYTPKGRNIDQTGIEPDRVVELTADDVNHDRDPQLAAAKQQS